MMSTRETQPERTALSWIRTTALCLLIIVHAIKMNIETEISMALYYAITLLLILAYFKKEKLLLIVAVIALILSYWGLTLTKH